jgi:hypothetical protein
VDLSYENLGSAGKTGSCFSGSLSSDGLFCRRFGFLRGCAPANLLGGLVAIPAVSPTIAHPARTSIRRVVVATLVAIVVGVIAAAAITVMMAVPAAAHAVAAGAGSSGAMPAASGRSNARDQRQRCNHDQRAQKDQSHDALPQRVTNHVNCSRLL